MLLEVDQVKLSIWLESMETIHIFTLTLTMCSKLSKIFNKSKKATHVVHSESAKISPSTPLLESATTLEILKTLIFFIKRSAPAGQNMRTNFSSGWASPLLTTYPKASEYLKPSNWRTTTTSPYDWHLFINMNCWRYYMIWSQLIVIS